MAQIIKIGLTVISVYLIIISWCWNVHVELLLLLFLVLLSNIYIIGMFDECQTCFHHHFWTNKSSFKRTFLLELCLGKLMLRSIPDLFFYHAYFVHNFLIFIYDCIVQSKSTLQSKCGRMWKYKYASTYPSLQSHVGRYVRWSEGENVLLINPLLGMRTLHCHWMGSIKCQWVRAPIKGSRCFLELETLPSLLSTGTVFERDLH